MEAWKSEAVGVLERPEVEPTVGNREPAVVRDGGHQTDETGDGLARDMHIGGKMRIKDKKDAMSGPTPESKRIDTNT